MPQFGETLTGAWGDATRREAAQPCRSSRNGAVHRKVAARESPKRPGESRSPPRQMQVTRGCLHLAASGSRIAALCCCMRECAMIHQGDLLATNRVFAEFGALPPEMWNCSGIEPFVGSSGSTGWAPPRAPASDGPADPSPSGEITYLCVVEQQPIYVERSVGDFQTRELQKSAGAGSTASTKANESSKCVARPAAAD